MKSKNIRRRMTPPTLATAARNDQKFNTCCEYFKVKKSPTLSVDPRELTALEAVQDTCGSSITADQTKDRDQTPLRPRRLRHDSLKQSHVKYQASSGLCIEDVQMLVEAQDSYDGGVNCSVCGKLYKSKVCFIKHIWEHTIYWDVFDKAKNHERVLSIQAAIILYSGMASQTSGASKSDLCNLLVTSPHSSEMKQERDSGVTQNSDQLKDSFLVLLSEKCAEKTPLVVKNGKGESDDNAVGNLLHNSATKHTQGVATNRQNASSDNYIQTPSISSSECCLQPSFNSYLQSQVPTSHATPPTSQVHSTLLSIPPSSRAHSTLLSTPPNLQTYPAVFFSPTKPHFYPAKMSPRPHSYPDEISPGRLHSHPAEIFPPTKPHSYPILISPARPHSYPTEISPSKPYLYPDKLSLTKPHHPFEISLPKKPRCYPTLFYAPPQPQMFPIFSSSQPKPQTYQITTSESVPVLMLAASLPGPQLSSDACQGFKTSRHPSNDAYGTLGNNGANFVSPLKRKRED